MNQLISNKGVCRTAQATPCLLTILVMEIIFQMVSIFSHLLTHNGDYSSIHTLSFDIPMLFCEVISLLLGFWCYWDTERCIYTMDSYMVLWSPES